MRNSVAWLLAATLGALNPSGFCFDRNRTRRRSVLRDTPGWMHDIEGHNAIDLPEEPICRIGIIDAWAGRRIDRMRVKETAKISRIQSLRFLPGNTTCRQDLAVHRPLAAVDAHSSFNFGVRTS